jgi:hypothetical protein
MINHTLNITIVVVIILLFGACNSNEKTSEKHPPSKAKISTKFILISSGLCYQDKIKSFTKMKTHDCMFTLDEETYTIRSKCILDKEGKINSYWSYLPEGPDIHSFEELKNDPNFFEYIGGEDLNIKIIDNIIIDGIDTFRIEKIRTEEKLIFVKSKTQLNEMIQRAIYQYQ